MKTRSSFVAALAAFAALAPACAKDEVPFLARQCGRGEVLNRAGECVEVEDEEDTSGNSDTDPDIGDDTLADIPDGSACVPEARRCIDLTTLGICAADGSAEITQACNAGTQCVSGQCIIQGTDCTPGEVLSCNDASSLRICADDAINFEVQPCGAATPNCIDGECTDRLCSPGEYSCDGQNVTQCNGDGLGTTVTQPCEFGCLRGECVDPCASDGKNYLGCDFFAADLDNYEGGGAEAQFAVTVSNTSSTPVDVQVLDAAGGTVANVTVAGNALEIVNLPRLDVNESVINSNSYRIKSESPITVHQFNPLNNEGVASNDASLLLPATSLGTNYIVTGWPTGGEGLKAFVTIIAPADGETEISVTSPTRTAAGAGGQPAALQPGVARSFTLTTGQVLSFTTEAVLGADLTGMEIVSDKPVAVFSGAECANIPLDNRYCDHLEEQLFPVETWGTEFVGAKFKARGREPDVWRVLAAENETDIITTPQIPGIHGIRLGRGEFREFVYDGDFVLRTTGNPISLSQFMVGSSYPGGSQCDRGAPFGGDAGCLIPDTCDGTAIGDPAFLTSVPVAQYRDNYIVLTPAQYVQNFVSIVASPGDDVTIDGRPVGVSPSPIGTWNVYRVELAAGVHTVAGNRPIGLFAYGYDCDVSYAYPGGLNLDALR